MKTLRLLLGALTLGVCLAFGHHQLVQAAGADFTVTPQLGQDQINGTTDYFNLLVQPGQSRPLQVTIENTSASAKDFTVSLTNAFSQGNGEIGYEPKGQVDSSLTVPLTSMSSQPEQTVRIPAGGSQLVTVPLQVPAEGFDGVKLGAIYVLDQSVSEPTEAGEGISLSNRFAMVMGVQLQTNADAVVLTKPDLKLGTVAAGTEKGNANGGVIVNLRNVAPIYIDNLKATVTVTRKGEDKPTLERTVSDWSMAPNSVLPLTVPAKKELKAGDYTVKISAATPDQDWQFTEHFTIKEKEAKKVNKALGLTPPPSGPTSGNWPWLAAGGVALLALTGGLFWWRRRSRQAPAA